jgi:hypothetical protein
MESIVTGKRRVSTVVVIATERAERAHSLLDA